MSMAENAKKYYLDQSKNCAVATLLGASDTLGLGLTAEDAALLTGFGGGIGCGRICGCAAGSVAILGKLYAGKLDKDAFRELCGGFVAEFEEKMGCGSINCAELKAKYNNEENRCWPCVEMAAKVLEDYIAKN